MPLQQITVSQSPSHQQGRNNGKDPPESDVTGPPSLPPSSAPPLPPGANNNSQTPLTHQLQESIYTPSPATILGGMMMERCGSQASVLSMNHDICRICHCEGDSEIPLIAPCYCSGSLRYVHQACLQQWIKSSDTKSCELCKFQFIMQSKIKPFGEWEKLAMSPVERRKLLCSVTFHAVALTCVVWSLYVLIDRTAEEVRVGLLEWPFWTKLVVVAIGFTGGLVFMYIQCKMYVQLCRRWRAFNRVIFVQNAPEKPPPPPPAPAPAPDLAPALLVPPSPQRLPPSPPEDEPAEDEVLVPVSEPGSDSLRVSLPEV